MTYPASAADVRELIAVMRAEGAIQACGIVLGPPPTKLEALKAQAEQGPSPVIEEEIRVEERRIRIEAARQDVRDLLAHTGRAYSDDEIDRFIDPRVLG